MKSVWLVWIGTVLVFGKKKGVLAGIFMIVASLLVLVDSVQELLGYGDEEDD